MEKLDIDIKNLKGFALTIQIFRWLHNNLPDGKTILELGSGTGTIELCKHYKVYSIEDNEKWLNVAPSNYIHAPIVNRWYDVSVLKEKLPKAYDLILIDGPIGSIGRIGFYENLSLFRTDVPMIFDDVERPAEYELITQVSKKLNREFTMYETGPKKFGVILPS